MSAASKQATQLSKTLDLFAPPAPSPPQFDPQPAISILARMEDLIGRGIARRTNARNAAGQRVRFDDRAACAWCISGARQRALQEAFSSGMRSSEVSELDRTVSRAIFSAIQAVDPDCWSVPVYSDTHTQAEVLALLRDARTRLGPVVSHV